MQKFISFVFLILFSLSGFSYSEVSEISKPDRWVQVVDPKNLIDEGTKLHINTILENHRVKTTNQITVVVVDQIENTSIKQFATAMFQKWEIGEKGKDNGLLILLSLNDRRVEFEVGYGLEGDLPDVICKRIQMDSMIPHFKNGNYAAGLLTGVLTTIGVLENTVTISSEPINTKPKLLLNNLTRGQIIFITVLGTQLLALLIWLLFAIKKNPKKFAVLIPILIIAGFFLFVGSLAAIIQYVSGPMIVLGIYAISLVLYVNYKLKQRKPLNEQWTAQQKYSLIVEQAFPTWSLFLYPLPLLFFRLWENTQLRKLRQLPQVCELCKSPMHLLSNVDELKHLTHAQKVEQEIKSIDHDVWYCDKDTHIQIFHAKSIGTQYSTCTKCSAVAYHLQSNVVVTDSTYVSTGTGLKTFACKACQFTEEKTYTIPVKTRSSSSSSGSGGSSSGSSYSGGGRSGGGGAGSSW